MTKTSEKILVGEKIVQTRNGFLFTDIFAKQIYFSANRA